MSEVAIASGFGCVRRFNAAIRKVYDRTPTQIRRLARQTHPQPENQYFFRLRFRPPFHWTGMLSFLRPRATPGVEFVDDGVYRRSIAVGSHCGYFEVALEEGQQSLGVRVQIGDPGSLFFIIERIRAMFDMNADWLAIVEHLRTDPMLSRSLAAEPGLRVPGCWNGFELGVRAILGQQVSVKAATTLAGRLVTSFGRPFQSAAGLTHLFPTPAALAQADLGSIGITKSRAQTIRGFTLAVCRGEIRFESVIDTKAFVSQLFAIPGIGAWTAQYIAMRALGEPDAFPSGDLGFLHALGLENSRELEQRAEGWRPWRAYAAMYLWRIAGELKSCEKARSGDPTLRTIPSLRPKPGANKSSDCPGEASAISSL